MAYLFADGFDNYNDITQIWDTSQQSNGGIVFSSGNARFPAPGSLTSQGIKINQNSYCRKNLPSSYATLVAGCAFQNFITSNTHAFFSFEDSTTLQVCLAVTVAGALQFYRGLPSTNPIGSATANGVITSGIWHFIEIQVTINSSTGVVKCWLDGTLLINSTGLNTQASGNASANQVRIGDFNNATGMFADDFYCLDTTGSAPLNAPLGDSRIITKMPSSAGDLTNWTANGAGSNWQCVKEIPPDDDTTYVSSNTTSQRDSYTMQSASLVNTPNFVVGRYRYKKDDASMHTMSPLIKTPSGTTNVSFGSFTVASQYVFSDVQFGTDPSGGAWTASTADAVQLGQEETT